MVTLARSNLQLRKALKLAVKLVDSFMARDGGVPQAMAEDYHAYLMSLQDVDKQDATQ